jgi:anti-sigma regulatory factor (Ser/Thr protein kinase)
MTMESARAAIVVAATYESLGIVRRVLLAMLPSSIDQETRIRLGICLGEGFNNAVAHAYGGTDGRVEVGISLSPGEIVLEIADAGRSMSEDAKRLLAVAEIPDPEKVPLHDLPERGLGFGILRAALDDVGYTSRGGFNILRMVKRLDSPEPAR